MKLKQSNDIKEEDEQKRGNVEAVKKFADTQKQILDAVGNIDFFKNILQDRIKKAVEQGVLTLPLSEYSECMSCDFDKLKNLISRDEPIKIAIPQLPKPARTVKAKTHRGIKDFLRQADKNLQKLQSDNLEQASNSMGPPKQSAKALSMPCIDPADFT